MPPEKMVSLLAHMKVMIQHHPEEARVLLTQNPALSHALFQMMLLLGVLTGQQVPGVREQPFVLVLWY